MQGFELTVLCEGRATCPRTRHLVMHPGEWPANVIAVVPAYGVSR